MLQDTNTVQNNDDECVITIIADLIFIAFSAVLYLMRLEPRMKNHATRDNANFKEVQFFEMRLRLYYDNDNLSIAIYILNKYFKLFYFIIAPRICCYYNYLITPFAITSVNEFCIVRLHNNIHDYI